MSNNWGLSPARCRDCLLCLISISGEVDILEWGGLTRQFCYKVEYEDSPASRNAEEGWGPVAEIRACRTEAKAVYTLESFLRELVNGFCGRGDSRSRIPQGSY